MRTLICPDPRHYRERQVVSPTRAAQSAAAHVAEGVCPSCEEPLERVVRTRFGRPDPVGVCPCCHGEWTVTGGPEGTHYSVVMPRGCRLDSREVELGNLTI
ncbi:MAG: hypothetical protein Q8P22_05800 [Chloroflexota bacterium]|nr:hypothetical protein [Chloroflexota bacterium]